MGSIHCVNFNITMYITGWRHTGPSCNFYVTYHNKWPRNGSFTLKEPDSDLDSQLDGYIVLCRTCSHCRGLDLDSCSDIGQDSSSSPYPSPSTAMSQTRTWIPIWIQISLQKMDSVVTADPSPDWNPNLSLCNMSMFCIVQFGQWVRNRNLSQCLNLCLAM